MSAASAVAISAVLTEANSADLGGGGDTVGWLYNEWGDNIVKWLSLPC